MSYTIKELDELKRNLLGFSAELKDTSEILSKMMYSIGMELAHNAELRKKMQSDLAPSVNEAKSNPDADNRAKQVSLLEKQQRNLAKEVMANEKLFKPANKELAQKANAALLKNVAIENRENEKFTARKEWIGKHRARNKSESTDTSKEHITTPKLRK